MFPAFEGSSCPPGATPFMLCTTLKHSFVLCSPLTRTPTSELGVFYPTPSPPLLLPTPPGPTSATMPSPLAIMPSEIMQLVPRLLQPVPSFKNLLLICNPPSYKPSWKTLILITEVSELILPPNYPFYNRRSAISSAREDSSLKLGNALVRTEPVSTWG